MFRNESVNVHDFAMVPKAEIPRSRFRMQHVHKTAFDAGYLVPIYVDEMVPGDMFNMKLTAFCRLATPLFPTLDNLHLETFFFFVPMRLLWANAAKFFGEQANPGDSISYVVPQVACPAGGYAISSLQDYFGLPTVGQMGAAASIDHNVLPLRAYNRIYNEWFRDENLQNSVPMETDDGPDTAGQYVLLRRGKRHDYFTGCLPFTQKGTAVPIALQAPVKGIGWALPASANAPASNIRESGSTATRNYAGSLGAGATWSTDVRIEASTNVAATGIPTIYADLASVTVNQLRLSFQIQRLLERDARGGTRYTEIVLAHFGVRSPDARLQRPEYLGGGSTAIVINPVAQTSATNASGTDTPQGNLAAIGTGLAAGHGFTYAATEHGYVIGLVNVRADLSYQQGLRRMWSRESRYDFYWPAFAMLGEQTVTNKEIYVRGESSDGQAFGYQERWAEYRYFPSMITGLMRSTAASTIDAWHYAQEFSTLPTLGATFIEDGSREVVARATAVGAAANGQQFLLDCFFDNTAARPLPMYSVPGLIDHF